MDFSSDIITDGVRERRFTLDGVPGVLISPAASAAPGPLVLAAHGGGRHATHPATLAQAHHYASAYGFSVLTLDFPGHGARPASARTESAIAAMRTAMAYGSPAAAIAAVHAELAATAVPQWRAALDAVLSDGHARAPVGFIGLSMGAAIAVSLITSEARITAAVIGTAALIGLSDQRELTERAGQITVPVQLVVQWDDQLVEREDALALFTAIGSSSKTLHANPGGGSEVPAAERESAARFLAHHLLDIAATAVPDDAVPERREGETGQRLRCSVVLAVEEDSCEVLIDDQPVSARYVRAFPSPRTERITPGHLVALATADDGAAVVVFRWYDAVVLGTADGQVQMWEPAHGQVMATTRHPHHHHQVGARAYLSAGLPGADWWLAGPTVAAAQQADVELDEVERFCTEHGLFDQLT